MAVFVLPVEIPQQHMSSFAVLSQITAMAQTAELQRVALIFFLEVGLCIVSLLTVLQT